MPNDRPYTTSYFMAIVMFVLSVIIFEIVAVEMPMTKTLTFVMSQGQMLLTQSKGYMRLLLLAIAMFVLFVTVCEIITYERPEVLVSNL